VDDVDDVDDVDEVDEVDDVDDVDDVATTHAGTNELPPAANRARARMNRTRTGRELDMKPSASGAGLSDTAAEVCKDRRH
jgi:hypothetical protein